MIKSAYYKVRRFSEAAWHDARTRFYRTWDHARDLFERIDAETRPSRRRAAATAQQQAVPAPSVTRTELPRVPEDTRVYAVGDIHGRADLLRRLVELIRADAEAATENRKVLIFLGDYIDRGFQSRDVIDFLLGDELSGFETYFLKGNHEAAFETFLSDSSFGPQWARFGGAETVMSYGIQPPRAKTLAAEWEPVCMQLNEELPQAHRGFLDSLSLYAKLGDYVFVHAGLRPGQALESQSEKDLLWIREDFLKDTSLFDQVVVHGHTPINAPHKDARRIGVDTGAYLTGKLTAVCLAGTEVSFLST